jgi:hypothetical protein
MQSDVPLPSSLSKLMNRNRGLFICVCEHSYFSLTKINQKKKNLTQVEMIRKKMVKKIMMKVKIMIMRMMMMSIKSINYRRREEN